MYSRALQEQESNTNKNKMQNVNVFSTTKFHALFNGAIVFAVSLILYSGKWIGTTIHQNCDCFQPPISAYRTQITRKQNAPFERTLNFDLAATLGFLIYFAFV
jgi:hypothetical protein